MIGKFKKGSASIYDDTTGLGAGYEEGPDLSPTGGQEYDPLAKANKAERQRQLLNLLDNNPNTFLDELPNSFSSGGQDFSQVIPYGSKESSPFPAEWEGVAFESEQSKQLHSRQMELDTLKENLANIKEADLDLPMGAMESEAFERAARQQKVAKKLGKKVKKPVVKETPPEYKDLTIREYYENKIIDLELDIEMEKQVMGDTYEKTARTDAYNLATEGQDLDDIDKHLALELSPEETKIGPSKSSKNPITNVAGGDVTRPRKDLSAPLQQVPKGTAETMDLYDGKGTFLRFDKDIQKAGVKEHFRKVAEKNYANALNKEIAAVTDGFKPSKKSKKTVAEQIESKAIKNLMDQDISVDKLVVKYTVDYYNSPKGKAEFGVGPQMDIVTAERFPDYPGANRTYGAASTPNPRYSTTGIEGVDVQPTPKAVTSGLPPIADQTRKKFKAKYASGTVKGKEKTIVNLPDEDIKTTDAYNKAYTKAIASGLDDMAAVAFALKAAKNIKKIVGKGNLALTALQMMPQDYFNKVMNLTSYQGRPDA